MTKANVTQYDKVAANNTDVQDVPLGENAMYPADVNNAFRELMADIAEVNDGTTTLTSPAAGSLSVTGNITVGGTVDGRDVATDGTKLDGIEAGATADQSAAEIKTAYESNLDTNAYTDAEKTKLAGIAAGAEVNTVDSVNTQTGAVVLDADDISDAATTNKFTTAADITKLAGIETGATADQTGAEIATALSGQALSGITSATVTGDLTVDTNTLYVDSTNNRVGIGTSSPYDALTVDTANGILSIANGNTSGGTKIQAWGATPSNGYLAIEGYTKEYMRIDSSGNVGIGTSSPTDSQLDVRGTAGVKIGDGTCTLELLGRSDLGYAIIGTDTNHPIVMRTNNTERMRIDSSGNVGIGTTSPSAPFHIHEASSASAYMRISNDTTGSTAGNGFEIAIDSGERPYLWNYENTYMYFGTNNGERMRLETDGDLHVDGNVVAYSTTISDIRLKKDIAPIEDAVTKVQQLNGCTFTYLKDDRKSAGLIAQDVEKVLPSAVIEDEAVFHGEEGETYKTVQYDQLIGLLVEAVKELKAEIEELKNGSSN